MAVPMQQGSLPDRNFLFNVFQSVDKDRSGYITDNELQSALSNGTWEPFNPKTIHLMIALFDKEKRRVINFENFGLLWKYVMDWQNIFRSFDRNNSGSIDIHELTTALVTFGYRLQPSTIDVIMKRFDRLRKNSILFDDFIQCCLLLQILTDAFRRYDTDQDGVITLPYDHFLSIIFELDL